jgi:hypothetical protein
MAVADLWTKSKNGKGVSDNFATASDWSGGVPGAGNDVVINLPGAYTITSSVNETVAGIQMSGPNQGVPTLDIAGGTFTATNGTDGGSANGNILVEGGAILDINGNWGGSGRLNANGGTINVANAVTITGTNVFTANGGDLELNNDTITQGVTAGAGGQIRTGQAIGGVVDIIGGTVTYGSVDARAVDGNGLVNLEGVTLIDVLLDTQTFAAGFQSMQTTTTGTVLDGVINGANPKGVINTAHLMVLDGTDLTLEGTITNTAFVDPGHPAAGDPTFTLGYAGIFLNGGSNDTTLWVNGNTTLTGGGIVVMSDIPGAADSVANTIDGTNPDALGTGLTSVTLTTNNTIEGAGNIGHDDGSLSVTNTGKINAISAIDPLTIDLGDEFAGTRGTLSNAGGTLESSGAGIPGGGATLPAPAGTGGLFISTTNVSGGTMVIATDSFVDSDHSNFSNVRVKFDDIAGNTGMWFLDFGSVLTGTTAIEGFAGGGPGSSDELDFRGLTFGVSSKATWTQGVGQGTLAITSGNGKSVLNVTLIGTYAAGTGDFQVAADGLGGTVVTTSNSTNQETFAL